MTDTEAHPAQKLLDQMRAGTMPAAASEKAISTQARRSADTIEAVADSADFGPAYRGEEWVTLTFRVPKSQAAIPGIWELTPIGPGSREWAKRKYPIDSPIEGEDD